jgi:hypothetical protein
MPKSHFITDGFGPALRIPRSCIEGAEYIIQCIAVNDYARSWRVNQTLEPHVYAEFGGGIRINISEEANFHKNPICVGLQNYDFATDPVIGEGIILLNKTKGDKAFNMHLGAIVAIDNGTYYISDVSHRGRVIMNIHWEIKPITTLNGFRGGTQYPHQSFAMGLLRPDYRIPTDLRD